MRFLSAHRTPRTRLLAAGTAAVASAVLLAPAGAQAAFTLPACGGSAVAGNGSTLQGTAHTSLWSPAFSTDSTGTCSGITVTYNGAGATTGSGGGKAAMGSKDGTRSGTNNPTGTRFGGTDEAPTPVETGKINAGDPNSAADDAKVHVIPVAATSIAIIVNLPASCKTVIPAGDLDASGRLKVSNAALAKAFAAVSGGQTWGDLIASAGTPTADTTCAAEPVHRIVRPTDSGSSFAVKGFLDKVGNQNFLALGNTEWPNAGAAQAHLNSNSVACIVSICDGGDGNGKGFTGGGDLATLAGNSPGSIGYAALPDARGKGFDFDGTTADTKYWLSVEGVQDPTKRFEPTSDANGWKTSVNGGQKGANCNGLNPAGVPTGADPTLGDWTGVDPTGGAGYPACTFTYDLVFDDNVPAWGSSSEEEAKARSVKDYFTYVVSTGQQKLGNPASDYSPLSASLGAIAQNGVAAIGWNKTQGGGPGTPTDTTPVTTPTTPTTTPTTPTTPTITTPVAPSNAFSISSKKAKGSAITVGLTLPGAGKLVLKATTTIKGKKITFASKTVSTPGGKGTVTFTPSAKAKAALKKVKTAKVTVAITFTPAGGTAASKSASVTVKGTLKAKKATKKKSSKR